MELLKDAPSSSGLPQPVKDFFMKLITHSVDLGMEKRSFRDKVEQAGAQVQEAQEHIEYQAEQMMDLQSQVCTVTC